MLNRREMLQNTEDVLSSYCKHKDEKTSFPSLFQLITK